MNRIRVLLIGPLPPPLGGATVLFQQLVDELQSESDIEFEVIRTNPKSLGRIKKILYQPYFLFLILIKIGKYDVVSYHASISGGYKLSFFIRIVCLWARKPWSFRGFGGNFAAWYELSPSWRKSLFRQTVLKADLLLFETKQTVAYFNERFEDVNVQWYPNSRKLNNTELVKRNGTLMKFVYIGHVRESKGLLVLLEASKKLLHGTILDIYGPLLGGMSLSDFKGFNVNYKGVLKPEEIPTTLLSYDVFVFPSIDKGEGYPGVILEAYGSGLPVISTKLKSIPEIVDESSGLLVEPGNSSQLAASMNTLSDSSDLVSKLRKGAMKKARYFNSKNWTRKFITLCHSLV